MKHFPPEMRFQKTWRSYQARILSDLEGHMDDDRLNVVAAPGSGKTVLGLEVVRRLDKPTLILSPTLAIRDQWVDRLVQLFLPGNETPPWISRDIRRPGFLTAATYHALHAAHTGWKEEEEGEEEEEPGTGKSEKVNLIDIYQRQGIGALVLDEAHHLKSEWWKSLVEVKEGLPYITVVSLTATPPYDSPIHEWERYIRLCGEVDCEVSVPELVLKGNLCPHQDYVHFSVPTGEEKKRIRDFRKNVRETMDDLRSDPSFIRALEAHPFVQDPDEHIEEILDDPAFASSILIFLHSASGSKGKKIRKILGLPRKRIPKCNLEWMEILLEGCLFRWEWERDLDCGVMDELRKKLKRIGAVERRRIRLKNPREIGKILSGSARKLDGILEIVRLERDSLGNELRMVILTDFIRKADLPRDSGDEKPLTRPGVVPIFEKIRRSTIQNIRLGTLSGSLVIVPSSSREKIGNLAPECGIDPKDLRFSVLKHDERYLQLEITGEDRKRIVRLVTLLFRDGGITVLVGTKSLLGEGWDAPSINTLVLASFVGSFVLSNQMRGRAIRVQPGNPEKTADIWHLVCLETGRNGPGEDYETLERRFRAFVGVSFEKPLIQSGIERIGLGDQPFEEETVDQMQIAMREMSFDRESLRSKWNVALGDGEFRMVRELESSSVRLPRGFVFYNTISAVVWNGIFAGLIVFSRILGGYGPSSDSKFILTFLMVICIAGILGFLAAVPFLLKALWLFLRHGPVASSMKQIAKALVRSLALSGGINTDLSAMEVKVEKGKYGSVSCSLKGGTSYEKSNFLEAMREILDPIENPRYILVRKTTLGRFLRRDFHAVPGVLGKRKETARIFAKMWKKYVGSMKLVYTRTPKGRRLLLKARVKALSSRFRQPCRKINRWK